MSRTVHDPALARLALGQGPSRARWRAAGFAGLGGARVEASPVADGGAVAWVSHPAVWSMRKCRIEIRISENSSDKRDSQDYIGQYTSKRAISDKYMKQEIFTILISTVLSALFYNSSVFETDVKLLIAGREYVFPKRAIDVNHDRDCNQRAIGFKFHLLPNGAMQPGHTDRRTTKPTSDSHDIWASIHARGDGRDQLPEDLRTLMSSSKEIFGPHEPGVAQRFGLSVLRPSLEKNTLAKEILFQPSQEAPLSFMVCGVAPPSVAPRCEHKFVENGVTVRVSYQRQLLSEWVKIEAALRNFLALHLVGLSEGSVAECSR